MHRQVTLYAMTAAIAGVFALFSYPISCNMPGQFFGQTSPGLKSAKFVTNTFSSEGPPHSRLEFAPDGKRVIWTTMEYNGIEGATFESTFDDTRFLPPAFASLSPDSEFKHPTFSHDGDRLFFASKSVSLEYSDSAASGIWMSDRKNDGWSQPAPIASTLDSGWHAGSPSVSQGGNLYFAARVSGGGLTIYVSQFTNGEYSDPRPLDGAINQTIGRGILDPFVDPQERFILFAGFGQEESFGIADLFISYRQDNGSWGAAINLGEKVNTEGFERFPCLSPDGKFLFFVRCVGRQFPSDDVHYYWISSEILPQV